MSEYIKKENVDTLVDELARAISDERCFMSRGRSTASIMQDILDLPTYSFPETAEPEEGAELIDRRQIKWYGCDHEGHIKGINCDTADCSKCFYATVEHDEVMSLPVYRIPDSSENKGHWKVGFGNTWCSCSECSGNGSTNWSYCPWCGADMRGNTKCKRTPKEGNNESHNSYNCENWIP